MLADLLHPKAMSKRCINIKGFLGSSLLFPSRKRSNGAHIVKPVSELDDEHPQVLCHGHEHLAHRGCLLRFFGIEVNPFELGDPVHNGGEFCSEFLFEFFEGDDSVFYSIVQQRCRNGDIVHSVAGDDASHCKRMGDVGLA